MLVVDLERRENVVGGPVATAGRQRTADGGKLMDTGTRGGGGADRPAPLHGQSGWQRAHVRVGAHYPLISVRYSFSGAGPGDGEPGVGRTEGDASLIAGYAVALAQALGAHGTAPRSLEIDATEQLQRPGVPRRLELRVSGDVAGLDQDALGDMAAVVLLDAKARGELPPHAETVVPRRTETVAEPLNAETTLPPQAEVLPPPQDEVLLLPPEAATILPPLAEAALPHRDIVEQARAEVVGPLNVDTHSSLEPLAPREPGERADVVAPAPPRRTSFSRLLRPHPSLRPRAGLRRDLIAGGAALVVIGVTAFAISLGPANLANPGSRVQSPATQLAPTLQAASDTAEQANATAHPDTTGEPTAAAPVGTAANGLSSDTPGATGAVATTPTVAGPPANGLSSDTPGATAGTTQIPTESGVAADVTAVPLVPPTAAVAAVASALATSPTPAVADQATPTIQPSVAGIQVGSTPPPATTAAVTAPAGRVLLDVAPRPGQPGWPSDPSSTAWLAEDGYHLFARQFQRFVAVGLLAADQQPRDVLVSATFHKTGGPAGGGYGIIVRDQGPPPRDGLNQGGRYYVLEVGDLGQVGIWRREEDRWDELVGWTASAAVRPGTAENTLLVRAAAEQLTLSVNGTQVATTTDTLLTRGGVGVFLGGDQNEAVLTQVRVESTD
jgi:hypothetical protein